MYDGTERVAILQYDSGADEITIEELTLGVSGSATSQAASLTATFDLIGSGAWVRASPLWFADTDNSWVATWNKLLTAQDKTDLAAAPWPFVSGPTLTGPDSTTVDAVRVAAGTALDTATTAGLKVESSYSLSLTIDAQTATTLTQTDVIGTPTLGSPVDSLPVTADILAAGTTVWQIQQWVDDGTNPEVTRNITLAGLADTTTVQAMITTSNTTIGESFFGTNIIAVEDDMQFTGPDVVDTVTITYAADGTFTTDKDQTITFDLRFWSPSTGEGSLARVTVRGSAILGTSGITRALTRTLTRSLTRQV
jgi:hypothetical protein